MTLDQRTIPVYKITCPACDKESLYSLVQVITENFLHCTFCPERLDGAMYYSRPRVEELMKQAGYSEDFISINDKS